MTTKKVDLQVLPEDPKLVDSGKGVPKKEKSATKVAVKKEKSASDHSVEKKDKVHGSVTTRSPGKAKAKKDNTKRAEGNPVIARGSRKTAVASVFLWKEESSSGFITINGQEVADYFNSALQLQKRISDVFVVASEDLNKYKIKVFVRGGGKSGQADAVIHGIARSLSVLSSTTKPSLKKAGMLTRDARAVQSKAVGKPKARKSEQFSKR